MSKKELKRGEIIPRVVNKEISQVEASKLLSLSVRQVQRLCVIYREKGLSGFIHRNRGRPSNRSIPPRTKKEIIDLAKGKYQGAHPALLKGLLAKRENINLSTETIRKFMISENLWEVKKRKAQKIYTKRNRRSREGELVQIDGSYHDWFQGRAPKCCLLVMIDDATGKLQELKFVDHETVEDYMELTTQYIESRGKPIAFYSDKHQIFRVNNSRDATPSQTQFGRALSELDIELICANSPQAKGRVERANKTLQNRLIKLMAIDNISSKEEANMYLKGYIREHNESFAHAPLNKEDAHRPLRFNDSLLDILCVKHTRVVSKAHSISFENEIYTLKAKSKYSNLRGQKVQVYKRHGEIQIEHNGDSYQHTKHVEQPKILDVMDRKYIDAFLDRKQPLTVIQRQRRRIKGY